MEDKKVALYPVNKDGVWFCPNCDVELQFAGAWIGMMNAYRLGNQGMNYVCPKCGFKHSETTLFRD